MTGLPLARSAQGFDEFARQPGRLGVVAVKAAVDLENGRHGGWFRRLVRLGGFDGEHSASIK